MKVLVELEDDVAKAVAAAQRNGASFDEALNRLLRSVMPEAAEESTREPFVQRTHQGRFLLEGDCASRWHSQLDELEDFACSQTSTSS